MISRPLDLASKLRPEPRSLDWLFYVNAGLIVLFFSLFGSRFVLAPGVTALPEIAGADASARTTTHYITVHSARQIFAGDGLRDLEGLRKWFQQEARTAKDPVLLVQTAQGGVDMDLVARIMDAANEAGFTVHVAVMEPRKKRPDAEK